MNAGELITAFREDIRDDVLPYLWSESEAYRYLNEAYTAFVGKIGGVADISTEEVVEVPVVTGEAFVDLHPSILRITFARTASNKREVSIVNYTDLLKLLRSSDYGRGTIDLDATGEVDYLVVGEQRGKARLISVPVGDDTLQLNVYRMPLKALASDSDTLTDVDREHHNALIYWMRHLAYNKADADTFNGPLSDRFKMMFLEYCREAKAEWERYKTKPVRAVSYGGP